LIRFIPELTDSGHEATVSGPFMRSPKCLQSFFVVKSAPRSHRISGRSLSRWSLVVFAPILVSFPIVFAPASADAARALGVDVSSYQGGSINWTSVKGAGIVFAW